MPDNKFQISRRAVLQGTAASLGLAAFASLAPRSARAADYPSRSIKVAIPTGQGGAVDNAARAFTGVWGPKLDTGFEFEYYPGASGQVGYEIFIGKYERDGHGLLFGNIGPEMIMYATQNPGYSYPDDYFYMAGIDADDSVIWVSNESKFKTIQEMVEEGKKRTINLSTSRLPHPSSLGVLALGEATGAQFRLIPYGGGKKARSAAITGEVDGCATFMSSSLKLSDQINFLTVFQKKNRMPEKTNNAPPVNTVFGSRIPAMSGTRAWAVHTEFAKKYPDRYEKLYSTAKAAFDDAAYKAALKKAKIPAAFSEFSDTEACKAEAASVLELAKRYADVLKGTK